MFGRIIKIIKDSFRPNKLNQLIFFITSICDSRCRHCFYWKNLNQVNDLSLEEIKKISSSLPPFFDLLLSGGEPFLRKDLVEIIKIFRKNNKIKTVNIPTNSLRGEEIIRDIARISEIDPELRVYINISLDGPVKIHDYIRGVSGNFEKAIDLLKSVYKISEEKDNIFINLITVVNFYNYKYLENLMDYINKLKLPKVLHNFEILRGAPKESEFIKEIPLKDYDNIYKKILDYQTKRFKDFYGGGLKGWFQSKLNRAHLKCFYKIQKNRYFNIKKWPMDCVAGRNIFVIDYNGDVRACELRGKIINIREENYNLSSQNKIFKKERKNIKKQRCDCTHICFLYQSMHYSPRLMSLYILPDFIKSLFTKI